MIYNRLFFFLVTWWFALSLHADIGVVPMIIDLSSEKNTAEIAIQNFDTQNNTYVEITGYRIKKPSDPASPKIRIHHPEKDGLLVFPAKLVLLPGQTQYVRVVKTTKETHAENVYEIDVIPKVVSQLVESTTASGVTMGIRVIVGYGARVIARPDNIKPGISVKRNNHQLIIKNTGNTALSITSCTQEMANKKVEVPLPAYTLFVGQTITKQLPQPKQVTLNAAFMDKPFGSFRTD